MLPLFDGHRLPHRVLAKEVENAIELGGLPWVQAIAGLGFRKHGFDLVDDAGSRPKANQAITQGLRNVF